MSVVGRVGRVVGGTLVVLMECTLGWFSNGAFGCFSFLEKDRAGRRRDMALLAVPGLALTALVFYEGERELAAIPGGITAFVLLYLLAVDLYLEREHPGHGPHESRLARDRSRRWSR